MSAYCSLGVGMYTVWVNKTDIVPALKGLQSNGGERP